MQLENVDISQTQIEVISESAFIDSGLKEIILPSNLKEIASQAFYGTANLQNISINRSTTVIGNKAFYNSGLTSITLHNGLNTIGYMAFANCTGLTKISKTSESTNTGGRILIGAFQDCTSLTEATLPDNITTMEGYTFIGCENLGKIILPKNLKSIGDLGLRTNYDVSTIVFNSLEIPVLSNIPDSSIPNVLPFVDNINEILVPSQSVEEYKNRLTSYADKIKENQIHDASK